MRRILILGCGIFAVAALVMISGHPGWAFGFWGHRPSSCVAKIVGVTNAVWAKDSQAIFFTTEAETRHIISKYNLATKKTTRYTVPAFEGQFDISPDGQAIVYSDDLHVYTAKFGEATGQVVYTVPLPLPESTFGEGKIIRARWLANGKILYSRTVKTATVFYLLDPNSGIAKELPVPVDLASVEGTRVVLYNTPDSSYLYDIVTDTSQRLPAFPPDFNRHDLIYLSQHELIYRYYPVVNGKQTYHPNFYRLDLQTLHSEPWRDLPADGFWEEFSPDLQHYFILSWGPREPGQISIYRMPPAPKGQDDL